jgi:hypothetical protein
MEAGGVGPRDERKRDDKALSAAAPIGQAPHIEVPGTAVAARRANGWAAW